jgi:hypothetical protein
MLLLASCNKYEDLPDRTPHYPPQEVKDYCYFLPGTYWLYQDSLTGIKDSVYVISAGEGLDTTYNSDGKLLGFYGWFTTITKSSNTGDTYEYNFNASWSTGNGHIVFRVRSGSNYGNTIGFLTPLMVGSAKNSIYSDGIITITGIYSNINVNSNLYHNIVEINDNKNSTEKNENTLFYYSKNIGIVKKKFMSSQQNWGLIKYNIIQ